MIARVDVVLLHSGVTDPGEWDGMRPLLEREHRVVAPDLRQSRPLVELALDAIPGESAALVGTSFGGRGALEAAAAAPDRVEALVLINSNPFGWSDDVQAIGGQEVELFEAGRLDEAAALMVRAWLVGPRRDESDVPAELRERVLAMQRRAYALDADPEAGEFELADVRAPLLFIRGALDWPEVEQAAAQFPGAQHAVVEDAAHLPTLERPDEVARLILDFLADARR
jgi:pimeloyl-ACP methyl ester carboxylesterase